MNCPSVGPCTGAVLQEQAAPAWVPHGVTSPASKPALAWASPSTGLQVLAGAYSSAGSPWGHSFRHPPAPVWDPFHRLLVDICCTVDLHGLQEKNLPHHDLSSQTVRKDSAPASRAPPSPCFFTDLVVCRFVSFTSSNSSLFAAVSLQFLLPLLKYVVTEVPPPLLIGLALLSGGSVLEPAGTSFIRHGASFWQLPTEATPVVPQLPKPCHANP